MTARDDIIACVWDFDKTLIPGYMQAPLLDHYGISSDQFWREVNALPEYYEKRGFRVSRDILYLNHLLSYVKNGPMRGMTNADLRALGAKLSFFPGLPDFFSSLQEFVTQDPAYKDHELRLEHYIVSTGLAEMIRGSAIAPYTEGIYGCEFIEQPAYPDYLSQGEFDIEPSSEISQIGMHIDNTVKTRFLFEINKGVNKNPKIDVNARVPRPNRRIPFENMIYIADGPSDVPAFSVIKQEGGKAFAVYNSDHLDEFEQNDAMLQAGRIHAYGPADYRDGSPTARWIRMHVRNICDRILYQRETILSQRCMQAPKHLHTQTDAPASQHAIQASLFGES